MGVTEILSFSPTSNNLSFNNSAKIDPDKTIHAMSADSFGSEEFEQQTLELQVVGRRQELTVRNTARADSEVIAIGLAGQLDRERLQRAAERHFGVP